MGKQEMVMKLTMEDAKKRSKALKTAVGLPVFPLLVRQFIFLSIAIVTRTPSSHLLNSRKVTLPSSSSSSSPPHHLRIDFVGVISAKLDEDKIVVVGDGVDSIVLTNKLRKKMGHVELVKVGSAEEKKEEKKEEKEPSWVYPMTCTPHVNLMPPVYEIREASHDPCRIM
ncbi:hypothetical protein MUK42_18737 [Musa troglodytarum]|uniref:Uncharacterized protein n=1 Tax=Musa troglodytarum TaxID=320322 RepID=A0A9E7FKW4_9LILI|nr:hypothetical protein MUK42_18737 [Musa troglodytarum]